MNAALLVLQPEEPQWLKLLLFALFFLAPLLGRLFKKAQGQTQAEEPDPREQRRLAREERRRAEAEGEDLWKRLARGEEPAEPPPQPARVPQPVLLEAEAEAEEAAEDLSEPAPLAVLGEVSEPADVSVVSLEQEVEPEPLAVLGEAKALEAPGEALRARFRLRRGELRRAVVLQEILAPPLALRGG